MKEKLTRNIGLKIISIILAALLWLVITNVDDPIKQVPFSMPVQVLNADKIANLNQVYEITEGRTIDFTASARRKIADKLTASDFVVTADLSKLTDVGAVAINIRCRSYPDDVTIKSGLQVMKGNLEDLVRTRYKVNVQLKGKPAEGYYVYEKTASTLIWVSGPKSKMEKIAQIVVDVDVAGITDVEEPFRSIEKPKALDADGKDIDASNLTFSESSVSVSIGVYKTKKIDLKIIPTGKPAEGYTISKVEYGPETIEVAADDDVLNDINALTVSEDITGASENIKKEVSLQEKLPEGVILVGDNQTAAINITIEKAETKEIMVLPQDINVVNKPEAIDVFYMTPGPITIKVIGPAKELKDINKNNLKPYIDLSNYTKGTYSVTIKADFTGYAALDNLTFVNINLI